jgi:DNA-binding transcriptional ArsR family regulator
MTARGSQSQPPDPRQLIALLADPARLRVYAALVLAPAAVPQSAAELSERAGVPIRDTARALTRFEDVRLAERQGEGWLATPEQTLREAVEALPKQKDDALPDIAPMDAATGSVLRGFFARGRLTHVPLAHAKRTIVLNYLSQAFEPGVRYPEAEVNEILLKFHDDCAALRRYLVDGDFLSRSEGFYWRTGGSVNL